MSVSTCLMFDGNAEEAISLYVSAIPNSSIGEVKKYAEGGVGKPGTIELASFTLDGSPMKAIDTPVQHEFTFTPAMSMFVSCESPETVDTIFAKLSEGGEVFMPLDTYPFSQRFVWFADQFGVSWQLTA